VTDVAENPLKVAERARVIPPPNAMVIFGGSGDLAHRKIIPALYNLELNRLLPQHFAVVGVSRSSYSDDEYRADMRKAVEEFSRTRPIQPQVWESFASRLYYITGSTDDPATYGKVGDLLERMEREHGTDGNRLFYMSLIPKLFPGAIQGIGKSGIGGRGYDRGWSRVVIEKPFGHDLASARELQALVTEVFPERDVFRIDHYLGKESVQNIIALRLPTASSSRSGATTTSTTCRSPWPSRSASSTAATSTRPPARSATSSRTTRSSSSR